MRQLLLSVIVALGLAGCGGALVEQTVPQTLAFAQVDAEETKIAELTEMLLRLGPGVDPEEAARVARIAVEEPLVWAKQWGVVDAPIIHNMQVNSGRKPRGLCKHWAEDLQQRLKRENLQSLDLHRAIANYDSILIEHSTLIVSAKGAAWDQGIVVDPWRLGQGQLYFTPVKKDPKYRWLERSQVFAIKRERKARKAEREARSGQG
ncbi:hypothetical protein J7443_16130 [Tropicibacter sp. R15_0]|uniref:hypothetical protein n=1 Tax=Tropicibacter sp. R15_0 TaxID=2821101 RepID=UPI001ADC6CD0|nr:hypothetical protein [Tropicibacter sp. R15_0]MBO9466772.1 hypothetical protein [Tropicibacter sp. R15_0]